MKKLVRNIVLLVCLAAAMIMASSCGGGGGGGATSTTITTDADSGSADGYVYTAVDGDAARSSARTTDRPAGYIPLAGATVECGGRTGITDANGYFRLTGIPSGQRTLRITRPGFNPLQFLLNIIRNQQVTATPQGDSSGVMAPEQSGSLTVTSTPDGAMIYVDGQASAFITPNTLNNVPAGGHKISVSLDGYDTPAAQTVEVIADRTATVDFTLTETSNTDPVAGPASYVVVDTNQAWCYGNTYSMTCPGQGAAFFGQDAQYSGAQPSYTDNGDGTITDNNTGLMWQKDPGEKMTFSQAVAGADSFSLAGYTDWRLPTIKELYSLILFSGMDPSGDMYGDTSGLTPFIDTDYFDFEYGDTSAGERIIDSQFASKNVYVGDGFDAETVFGVNFADGRIKGYGTQMFNQEKTFFVLYVRGNTSYGQNSFTDNGDGSVADAATGLLWTQADSGCGMVWEDALAYCENLDTAGRTDWRLPNAKELQSIVDYDRAPSYTNSAAIDPVFEATSITSEGGEIDWPYYWSSTTHANLLGGSSAAYLSFGRAMGYMNYSWVDVHGAGAQRSDPKTGDPSDYPTGHGPQGDAIRIYNYVRCVSN